MSRSVISPLPYLTAFLYILAFPNWNASWIAWVALLPLLYSLHAEPEKPREGFWIGWSVGTAANLGLLSWLIDTFQAAHQSFLLSFSCLFLLAAYMGLFWGVWAQLVCWIPQGRPLLFSFTAAATWVVLEWIRTWLFTGFPWTLLADSQVTWPPVLQLAAWTGVYGVSFLIVLFNATLAWLTRHIRQHRAWSADVRMALLPVGLVVAVIVAGAIFLQQAQSVSGPSMQVALLQGNIDQYKKWDRTYVDEIKSRYSELVNQATEMNPDLIVWPETSIPGYLFQDPALKTWVLGVIKKSKADHLIGSPTEIDKNAFNSTFYIDHEGFVVGQYDKRHLVPFGEEVPWGNVLGRFIGVLNALGGFTAGDRPPLLDAKGKRIGVTICYEAIFPHLVRESVQRGAAFIANQTNDGWYMRTSAPYQHWAANIFRAVENRRFVIRANNTGISGIIDPWGRVVVASPIFQSDVVFGKISPRTNITFYTRYGNIFVYLCLAFCIAIFARVILRRI